ncbi:MAG: hypothetical protein KJ737_18840 [Proteobacteria bacterium]|nr:hypothetical protein [Pseudomonadota bacterium]
MKKEDTADNHLKGTFQTMPGIKGKIFIPCKEAPSLPKKHPCKDCFSCQQCGDDRCQLCRSKKPVKE